MNPFEKPKVLDAFLLTLFTILITFNPYFMHGRINFFEIGLYLPGIEAVLEGKMPFRDVFHLRGPLEIYIPALLMKLWSVHLNTLYIYFYIGNVLCLILGILIAKELLQTRLVLYLMAPVFIARTYPRVVYMIWGGMRYALGLLAMLFFLKFLKTDKKYYLFFAGLVSAVGLLTSVEIGVYAIAGICMALIMARILSLKPWEHIYQGIGHFILGLSVILIPFFIYFGSQGALGFYVEAIFVVVTNMQNVFDPHLISIYPKNLIEALMAMTNFTHTNFKHMTPSYLYIFVLIYLIIRIRRREFSYRELFMVALGIYGFIMYNTGFRGLWAAQFEMSLQPEKILLFSLYEVILLALFIKKREITEKIPSLKEDMKKKSRAIIIAANLFCFILIGSSLGYAIQRYNHRFFAFKFLRNKIIGKETDSLKPLANEAHQMLTLARVQGINVPLDQAKEFEVIDDFIKTHVAENETILTYPEIGTYNFLFARPFPGRFPLVTMSWMKDSWHEEVMNELQKGVKHIIVQRELKEDWHIVYLGKEFNRQKYHEFMDFVKSNYRMVQQTPYSLIYQAKERR